MPAARSQSCARTSSRSRVAEARELLVERGRVALGDDEIELLHARTEGWPAALVLATLWLRRVPDLPAAVREFGGDQRFVADYLLSEVIGSLDADIRSFVLRVSVLGRFTPELCDGVFDRSDSASLLAELERSNHFMVRMERGGWYRVHSLLAELAELQLAAQEPGAVAETHRRAAPLAAVQGAGGRGRRARHGRRRPRARRRAAGRRITSC